MERIDMDEMHDPFEDQVECARFKAERDALAQRMEEIASEIDRTLSGVEGIEDAPAMRWMRGLREALGALHAPRIGYEDIEAARWVREHGGLDSVKKLLDWVVGHCSTKQQLDFDFWLSGRVMYELGFEEDRADRDEVERRLLARLMPEGMEWPTVDGRKVDFKTSYQPSLGVLEAVSIYNNGACEVMSHDGIVKNATEIHVFKPKVLDADGVEIREKRDVWWICEGDERGVHAERLRVETIGSDGLIECSPYNGGTWVYLEPSALYVNKPVPSFDGRPLREGETVYHTDTGREYQIHSINDDGKGAFIYNNSLGQDAAGLHLCPVGNLTHQLPVLDADGVLCREGDEVWEVRSHRRREIVGTVGGTHYRDYGTSEPLILCDGDDAIPIPATCVTHTKPEIDTWERIEEDARLKPLGYVDRVLGWDMSKSHGQNQARSAMTRDLVRRCKALAEKED